MSETNIYVIRKEGWICLILSEGYFSVISAIFAINQLKKKGITLINKVKKLLYAINVPNMLKEELIGSFK